MRFGLFAMVQAPIGEPLSERLDQLLEQVQLARENGFDSIFTGQHYLSSPYQMLQSIPLLARLAGETGGMKIGTGVLLLPLYNPVDVAEQIATLDIITGGRLIFGVGLGYRDVEYQAFGVDRKDRVGRFTEALKLVKRLWIEDSVSLEGRYFKLSEVKMAIKPVQKPHPPIWIAANSDRAVTRAAEMGDAWFINPHVSIHTLQSQLRLYVETLKKLGKAIPKELPILREVYVAEDRDVAFREARPHLESKYASYVQWGQDDAVPKAERFDRPFEELAEERFIIGNPSACIDEISSYEKRLGVNHFVMRMQWPGMPHSKAMKSLRLFGEKVIPYFRNRS